MANAYGPFFDIGTPVTWQASGGTSALTLTSLASAAARQGAKSGSFLDGTKGLPAYLEILFLSKMNAAAANGTFLNLFFGESDSATAGTANPGGLSGTDASLSNPAEVTLQLRPVWAFPLSNALGTGAQSWRSVFYPRCAYLSPVIVNGTAQALSSTAGDHVLTVTPYYHRTSY